MKSFFILLVAALLTGPFSVEAQSPDMIYKSNIQTVRLYKQGNQLTFPFINLNSGDKLELHFDDLDADVKSYYYTWQLCNFDWSPVDVMPMEYLSGFSQNRITDYRFSSVSLIRYTHYRILLPQTNSMPKKAGNYLIKVFLNGDPSQVVFTRRVMVLNSQAVVSGSIVQPTTPGNFKSYQKVIFNVDMKGINSLNAAQQVKVVLLQNFRWDNAMVDIKPTFIRGNSLDFNSELSGVFPAGREWRWLDLTDFHLQSDRVASADYNKRSTDIYLRTDRSWENEPYIFYRDLNGMSQIRAVRGIDPNYEGDYATVYFSFYPEGGKELVNKELYLYGQLTGYQFTDSLKMTFDETKGIYETRLLLKQGYYDYAYLARDMSSPGKSDLVDGNNFETENVYTILVYYRPFGARADELIAITVLDSRNDRKGIGF